MREDLNKLLCERERSRSWDHYTNYRHNSKFDNDFEHQDRYEGDDYEYDDTELFTGISGGSRESMKFRYKIVGDPKYFNENLNPLRGWIRKQVGRNWDKAYSELCQVFDKRSVINQHILQHLFEYVETKDVFVTDGKVFYRDTYSGSKPLSESSVEYYVDPRDGKLKVNSNRKTYRQVNAERQAERKKAELAIKRVIDNETELHKINDVWFEIKFKNFVGVQRQLSRSVTYGPMSKPVTYYSTITVYPPTLDILTQKIVEAPHVAVSKRSLSHKQLKHYGII